MKTLSLILVLLALSIPIFPQTGYQGYQFGMTIDAVRAKTPGLRTSNRFSLIWNTGSSIMNSLYRNEIASEIPYPFSSSSLQNPLVLLSEPINRYNFESLYLFHDNKLVGIITVFRDRVFEMLTSRYGNGALTTLRRSNISHEVYLWVNAGRFITWERQAEGVGFLETITYLDENWMKNICRRRIAEYRERQLYVRSRID